MNNIYDQLIIEFSRLIENNPQDTNLYYKRGIAYKNQGKYGLAIKDLTKALAGNLEQAGWNSFEVKKVKKAVKQVSFRTFLNILNERGIIFFITRNIEGAVSDFTKSIDICPNSIAYYYRGICFFKKQEFEHAIYDLIAAKKIHPQYVDIRIALGLIYYYLGKSDLAISEFNTAKEIKPGNVKTYLQLGHISSDNDDLDDAIFNYEKVISIDPNCAEAWYHVGCIYFKKQEFAKSLENISKAKALGYKMKFQDMDLNYAQNHRLP